MEKVGSFYDGTRDEERGRNSGRGKEKKNHEGKGGVVEGDLLVVGECWGKRTG